MNAKRAAAVFLTGILVFVMGTGAAFADTDKFTDINGHWAQSAINEAAGLGVVGGYPEGDFKPDNLMKREEFFKLVTNVLTTQPSITTAAIAFKDVDPIEWYVPTVKAAVAAGISNGYDDGTFGIGIMISRQEAAKVIASIISTDNLDSTKNLTDMKDVALVADWAKTYADTMYKKGYMKGDTDGNFRPTSALTRAEAATILLNVKKNEASILGPSQKGIVPGDDLSASEGGCLLAHTAANGAFTQGAGSSRDPYVISTASQLNHLRQHVTEGAFYLLKNDIALTASTDFETVVPAAKTGEDNWTDGNFRPIGTKDVPFSGHLDGRGKTISGLVIKGYVNEGGSSKDTLTSYVGLFGCIDAKSSVEDMKLDDSSITGNQYTGGVVGLALGSVVDCTIEAGTTVKGASYTGGIAGSGQSMLKGNTNHGTIEGTRTDTGGIVGYFYSGGEALVDNTNKGTVTGTERTGGVAGQIYGASAAVTAKNCSNTGTVNAGTYSAGGIAGSANSSGYGVTITNSYNSGEIKGKGVNGGIVGQVQKEKTTIRYCYNSGDISGSSTGGVAGFNEGAIEYSANVGEVDGTVEAGGIAGYQESGKITKCYNDGEITSDGMAGGIVGSNGHRVNNCYNTGKIEGSNSSGGIVGKNQGTVDNVYNIGTVSASNGAGALIGRNVSTLSNGFWLEDSCGDAIGMTDSSASQQNTKKMTSAQLSGTDTIKTPDGNKTVVVVMNENAGDTIWEFVSGSYKYPSIVSLRR